MTTVSTPPHTPRTPIVAQRYARLLEKRDLLTQQEMQKRRPLRPAVCCLMPKSTPKHAQTRYQLPPVMPTAQVHVIDFFNRGRAKLSSKYDPDKEGDYLTQTFTMVEVLGCGSFGVVVSFESKEDHRKYAVKYQVPYKNHFKRYEQLREVVFLQFINHPNCVRFYSAWEEADRLHIQFELCDGNLHKFLTDHGGDVPEPRVWEVLLDLLRALAYLHSNSIVHLDIKPENILMDSNGVAKLGDFGMAFDLQSDEVAHCRVEGDSRYLALEALDDNSKFCVSTKRDIYSLGVTILQLATDLWIPSSGEELDDIRAFRLPSNLLERMSGELRELLELMMSDDPVRRPEAAAILKMSGVREREAERREFVEFVCSDQKCKAQGDHAHRTTPRDSSWIGKTLAEIRDGAHSTPSKRPLLHTRVASQMF